MSKVGGPLPEMSIRRCVQHALPNKAMLATAGKREASKRTLEPTW